jgi:hypothetical protein
MGRLASSTMDSWVRFDRGPEGLKSDPTELGVDRVFEEYFDAPNVTFDDIKQIAELRLARATSATCIEILSSRFHDHGWKDAAPKLGKEPTIDDLSVLFQPIISDGFVNLCMMSRQFATIVRSMETPDASKTIEAMLKAQIHVDDGGYRDDGGLHSYYRGGILCLRDYSEPTVVIEEMQMRDESGKPKYGHKIENMKNGIIRSACRRRFKQRSSVVWVIPE